MVKTAPRLDEPEEKLKWIFNAFDKGSNSIRQNTYLTDQVGYKKSKSDTRWQVWLTDDLIISPVLLQP